VYLHVLVGVPVTVVDDDGVSRGEVDAQAASPGGQQEDEDVGVCVEGADGFLAVLPADAAINAAGLVALALQVRIQQVKHLGHLHSHRIHALRRDPSPRDFIGDEHGSIGKLLHTSMTNAFTKCSMEHW